MARSSSKSRSTSSSAASSSASPKLDTIRPSIQFLHGDGSHDGVAEPRALRIVKSGPHKGAYGIERRRKIMPITVIGPRTATCNLAAEPLIVGYADAQAVAPVATLEAIGVSRPAKPAAGSAPKGRTGGRKSSTSEITPEDAVKALANSLKGQPQEAVQAAFLSIVEMLAPKGK